MASESIRNFTVYGNYNENIEGDYNQYRSEILKLPFIDRPPYKGLKRFNAKDKDLFFGRDGLIKKLIAAVNQSNLVLVLGASGSGKSSVVRAGVMPQMENLGDTRYESCLFIPNRDPFVNFHRSLLDPTKDIFTESEVEFILEEEENTINRAVDLLKSKHSHWLIFIDQFEELFTICKNLETRRNFIQGMMQIAETKDQSIKLILAMRSDFLEEFSAYPVFAEIAEKNINLVADMQPAELRQAIASPAANHGIVFESGLVEEIIEDVQGQAASLPLLQYTLDLLWQDDDLSDRTLNIITYRNLGGVTGALQKHVNQIYQGLNPEQQVATKQIFLRLVDIVGQEKSENIRTTVSRRAYKSEFTEAQLETVTLLTDNNLLVSDNPDQQGQSTVEIAHESLLTSWLELKDWIIDARNTISLRNRLAEDTANWQKLAKNKPKQANDELWSGAKLEKVIEARKDGTFTDVLGGLSHEINKFLDASVDWKDRQIQEKLATAQRLTEESEARRDAEITAREEAEQRTREQKQANKKLRILSAIAVSVGIAASFLGITSFYRSQEAQLKQQAANIKVKLSLDNEIERLLESIQLAGNNQKLNQKWFKSQTPILPEVQSVLYQAVEESRERSVINGHQNVVISVAFSPDGKYLVSGSWDNTVKLWDVGSRSEIHTFNGHQSGVYSVAFSPDGKYLVSGSGDNTVKLWDVGSRSEIHTFNGHQNVVYSVAFSPDGKYLVSGSLDNTVKLWDVGSRSEIHTFNGHQDRVYSVAFSPDGKYLVSGSLDNTVKLWDVGSRSEIHTFNGHQDRVYSVAFSPDGKYLVSGSWDNTVKLWDVGSRSEIHTFNGHQDRVYSVAFSPDGKYLVSGSLDNTVKLWDVGSRSEIHTFNGHQDRVYSVAFSPDGKYLVSGSLDNTVKLWDVGSRSEIHTFNGHQSGVYSVAFSPDGKYLVSGSLDNTVKLWDVGSRSEIHTFNGHQSGVYSVAFSPDGKYLVSGSGDNTVKLWDVSSQSEIHTFNGHQSGVFSVAFSPDGKYLVSGSWDNTVKLWDVGSRSEIHTFNGHQDRVFSVAFSPDGKYLVSGSWDNTVKLWDVSSRSEIHTFNGHQSGVFSVAFSPDGKYLVSGSWDNTVKLWDVGSRSEIHTFNGHQNVVTSVAFSPDGKYLVSGSGDNTVKLWRGIDWQDWLTVKCETIRLHPALVDREIDAAPDTAKTCLEYGDWKDPEKAEFLVKQGLAFAAQEGNIKQANQKFQQAAKLDPDQVNLPELETEANRLTEQFVRSQNK